ncbi:hypothetical protein M885DRAFT_472083, partial [Pelagophyceae sp. CCMP2097]
MVLDDKALTPKRDSGGGGGGGDGGGPDSAAAPRRARWTSRTDFLLATIGNCVGVGNVWRFPYLCYRNGGGSFLVPYFCALAFIGIPVFLLELAMGQRFAKGAVHTYRIIHPRLGGVGVASTTVTFVTCSYYTVIMAWSVVYMAHSCRSLTKVPWRGAKNDGVESERFWAWQVLHQSTGFEDFGPPGFVNWPLVAGLVLSWIALYFTTCKGIKSVGKTAYLSSTLPYFLLVALVVRGVTLEGAGEGLKFYLQPRLGMLFRVRPWVEASTQIIYSLGVGTGQMIAFGSTHDSGIVADALTIACLNSATSLFAGLAIFSLVGHMAHQRGVAVDDVISSGEGLAFVAYPDGLAQLPGAGFWCFVFFAMLFSLALGSAAAMVESWTTMLRDCDRGAAFVSWSRSNDAVVMGTCVAGLLTGAVYITPAGLYWFALVDSYVVWSVFIVIVVETIGVTRVYGAEKFSREIYSMTGRQVPRFVEVSWRYVTP